MSQQLCNKVKLSGQVKFDVFDENNVLTSSFSNHNLITSDGKNIYKNILSQMMKKSIPPATTSDDSSQVSMLSNTVDLGGESGDILILQPKIIVNKSKTELRTAINKDSVIGDKSNVSNPNSMFINSDTKKTIFDNSTAYTNFDFSTNLDDRWCYVYNVGNSSTDFTQLHTGLKVDIKGSQNKRSYFRVYYSYNRNDVSSYENIGKAVFPLVNGKPIYNQKKYNESSQKNDYYNLYGMQLMDDNTHSYFFDMYPRCCKIPQKITFVFQQNGKTNQATVSNVQFINHRNPIVGPIYIYLKGKIGNEESIHFAPIQSVKIKDNSIYYYAKVYYDEAVGLNIEKAGLCNAKNTVKYDDQTILNSNYDNVDTSIYGSDKKLFYKQRLANNLQCDNFLSQVDYSFSKTSTNRIDILYKINVKFKLDQSSSSFNSDSSL